jgi:2-(3-amino-3-carboxypropyl)histidine synthase
MEKVFIKAAYNKPFAISESLKAQFEEISDNIGLISTVQFSNLLPIIKKELEGLGKKVFIYREGVFLGCNTESAKKISDKVDAFLYVGSGKFHPLQVGLLLNKRKRIYIFHPQAEEIYELDWKEIDAFKVRQDVVKAKALSADKLGLLVSTKPGQCNLYSALKFKEKFDSRSKKAYLFLFDNFEENQIENWNELVYVNTACPGLALDKKFANLKDFEY